jgi:hypothetical protein
MTIFDLLEILSPVRGMPAVIMTVFTAFAAVALWNMRPAIPALTIHYLLAGLLLIDLLDPRLAVAYTGSGLLVTVILLITAWQVNWGRPPADLTPEEIAEMSPPSLVVGRFSLNSRSVTKLVLSLAALVAIYLVGPIIESYISDISPEFPYLSTAVISLGLFGLIGIASSTEPIEAGIGLLLFITGFVIFYSMLDPSITMVIALIGLIFLSALAIAYLAQARYWPVGSPV